MDKIEEAREVLKILGMPKAQQSDICCYTLLAMAKIKPDTAWSEAGNDNDASTYKWGGLSIFYW